MRTLGLVILLAVCLAPVSRAQEPAKSTNHDPTTVQNPFQDVKPADRMGLRIYRDASEDGETFCAFMRTYRVKRDHRGSDVVRPAGYTTCVPTRRFELKSAVEVQQELSPQ